MTSLKTGQTSLREGQTSLRFGQTSISSLAKGGGGLPYAGRIMFAGTRLNQHTGSWTPSASQLAVATLVKVGMPSYQIKNPRFIFSNFVGFGEAAPGNAMPVTGCSLTKDATTHMVTVGGSGSFSIPDGDWLISDPVDVTLEADVLYDFRTVLTQPTTATKHIGGIIPATQNGEGVLFAATADTGLLLAGAPIVGRTNTARPGFAPVAMIAEGWDGKPVYLLLGDSRQVGLYRGTRDARGNCGPEARAIDDDATGRRPYVNFGVSGGTLQSETNGQTKRLAILAAVKALAGGQDPYTDIIDNLGINSIRGNTTDLWVTVQGYFDAWWSYVASTYEGKPIWRTTMAPVTTDSNNRGWTTVADQVVADQNKVDGLLGQANAYIMTTPAPLAGAFDTAALIGADGAVDKYAVPTFEGTLAAAIAVSATSCTIDVTSGSLAVGDNLVFNPGVSGVDYAREFTVLTVTPNSSTQFLVTFGDIASKSQSINAPVRLSPTTDGVHGLNRASNLGVPAITAHKIDGQLSAP